MKINNFKCDECNTYFSLDDDGEFDYKNGRVFLYKLNFQKKSEPGVIHKFVKIDEQERHFCSDDCFLGYIAKLIGGEGHDMAKPMAKEGK